MLFKNNHLSYCTNIHSGETWEETFAELKKYVVNIKNEVSPTEKFGLGLRLSNIAVNEIIVNDFIKWLNDNDLYVFTANAFPFGSFHGTKVKDNVHQPDWTSNERLEYTKKFAKIMCQLPCMGNEQSISTSPLSYKYWHNNENDKNIVLKKSAENLIEVSKYLSQLELELGRYIHLNLEPEPDGLVENNDEFIDFYEHILIPSAQKLKVEDLVRKHIGLCYDICHYAVMYENHELSIENLIKKEIKIGKIQVSSALRIEFDELNKLENIQAIQKFIESTYLHQVVQKNKNTTFSHFKDLDIAIQNIDNQTDEWRVHFHVPIYSENFSKINATKNDILKVLDLNKKYNFSSHIEIETYTWDILPGCEKLPLDQSIIKEINWVKEKL